MVNGLYIMKGGIGKNTKEKKTSFCVYLLSHMIVF